MRAMTPRSAEIAAEIGRDCARLREIASSVQTASQYCLTATSRDLAQSRAISRNLPLGLPHPRQFRLVATRVASLPRPPPRRTASLHSAGAVSRSVACHSLPPLRGRRKRRRCGGARRRRRAAAARGETGAATGEGQRRGRGGGALTAETPAVPGRCFAGTELPLATGTLRTQ